MEQLLELQIDFSVAVNPAMPIDENNRAAGKKDLCGLFAARSRIR
jgi:hypothetical protein